MTLVNVLITSPEPDGTLRPITGWIQWTPTLSRADSGGAFVLPVGFKMDLNGVATTATVAPTGQGWAWRVDINVTGWSINTAYYTVPDQSNINFKDLTEVDPKTLIPITPQSQSWYQYSASLSVAISMILGG